MFQLDQAKVSFITVEIEQVFVLQRLLSALTKEHQQ